MKKIKLWVACKPAEAWEKGDNVIDGFAHMFWCNDMSGFDGCISAGTVVVNYEAPEGFDPRAGAVEALKKEREKLRAEFQNRITAIEEQINRYTALEAA